MERPEVIAFFGELVREYKLSASDLLTIAELCVRECSRREAIDKTIAKSLVRVLADANNT